MSRQQASWPDRERSATGPLRNIRVLDLSAFAVGPWAASLLAQLGADVIKIDPPYGDPIRMVRPNKKGESTTYTACNQGKRNVVLDLKNPEHHSFALGLASNADVVVENSRVGALDRLGLGYQHVVAVNPQVVYCSSSSFGDRGPMKTVGSTDPQGQAFGGFAALNGRTGDSPQLLRYVALVDLATSMYLTQAVLAGLLALRRTGKGQHIMTSQFEATVALQTTRVAEFIATGATLDTHGSGVAAVAPSRAFRCRDGNFVAVTANTDSAWVALCDVIGRPELAEDERFRTNAERVAHRTELDAEIGAVLITLDAAWWQQALTRAEVPNAPFLAVEDMAHLTHFRDSGHVVSVAHPVDGSILSAGLLWRFSKTAAQQAASPLPGAHNATVEGAPAMKGAGS